MSLVKYLLMFLLFYYGLVYAGFISNISETYTCNFKMHSKFRLNSETTLCANVNHQPMLGDTVMLYDVKSDKLCKAMVSSILRKEDELYTINSVELYFEKNKSWNLKNQYLAYFGNDLKHVNYKKAVHIKSEKNVLKNVRSKIVNSKQFKKAFGDRFGLLKSELSNEKYSFQEIKNLRTHFFSYRIQGESLFIMGLDVAGRTNGKYFLLCNDQVYKVSQGFSYKKPIVFSINNTIIVATEDIACQMENCTAAVDRYSFYAIDIFRN